MAVNALTAAACPARATGGKQEEEDLTPRVLDDLPEWETLLNQPAAAFDQLVDMLPAPPQSGIETNPLVAGGESLVLGGDAGAAKWEEFLDRTDLGPLLPPAPAAFQTDCAAQSQSDICPHCAGQRSGIGCYRTRKRERKNNPLALYHRKLGYRGPPYCQKCAETFRSHLLRPGRNALSGCSRTSPCGNCMKVLSHIDRPHAAMFAKYDVIPRQRSAFAFTTDSSAGAQLLVARQDSRKRKAAAIGLSMLCCTMLYNSQSLLSFQPTTAALEAEGRGRQLREQLSPRPVQLASVPPQTCCPKCCGKLPVVLPHWVFPFTATDYSILRDASNTTTALRWGYPGMKIEGGSSTCPFDMGLRALHWTYENIVAPLTCMLQDKQDAQGQQPMTARNRALAGEQLRRGSTPGADEDSGWFSGGTSFRRPRVPHIRLGLVVAAAVTVALVIASPRCRCWKRCGTLLLIFRPVLALTIALLADVLDPKLEYGLRHEHL